MLDWITGVYFPLTGIGMLHRTARATPWAMAESSHQGELRTTL
ncbi:MAG: hypothetical protein ACYTGU_12195 [Planctomycetota bacterium]